MLPATLLQQMPTQVLVVTTLHYHHFGRGLRIIHPSRHITTSNQSTVLLRMASDSIADGRPLAKESIPVGRGAAQV